MPATALITSPAPTPATPAAYPAAYEPFDHLLAQLRASQSQALPHSQLENLIEREGRAGRRRAADRDRGEGAHLRVVK